jgi:CRISPR type III-A-associated RAMP protein Csm5
LKVYAAEISPYIRDSFENPYIPGSSLKGALRTVIAAHLINFGKIPFEFNPGDEKKWAFKKMDKKVFGEDPKNDFMKGFMVVDSPFTNADLGLMLAKVYNMGRNNVFSVKLTRPDNPRSEMSIYCEFLKRKLYLK